MGILEVIYLVFILILQVVWGDFQDWLTDSTFIQAIADEWQLIADSQAPFLLLMAAVCGALVGLERERKDKPAGLRTNIMICVGSTLFTLASIHIWQHIAGGPPTTDPARIAAQIVTGVGFIGAGVILRTGTQITGITTAATIWLVAAIGMVIGLGLPLLGFLVSLAAAATLFLLGKLEGHLLSK